MTSSELLIVLMSIFFMFDSSTSATIHIVNIPFGTLLIIYIGSVIEISISPFVYKRIKRWDLKILKTKKRVERQFTHGK